MLVSPFTSVSFVQVRFFNRYGWNGRTTADIPIGASEAIGWSASTIGPRTQTELTDLNEKTAVMVSPFKSVSSVQVRFLNRYDWNGRNTTEIPLALDKLLAGPASTIGPRTQTDLAHLNGGDGA